MASKQKKTVSNGGFHFQRQVTVSKDTQELLKTMMMESRLTNLQQRKISERIENGKDLPLAESRNVLSPTAKRNHNRSCSIKHSTTYRRRGLRSMETIKQLEESVEQSCFAPRSSNYDSSVEKEKLHNIMAFGKARPIKDVKKCVKILDSFEENDIDRFEEVLKEIEERKEFLSDMAKLGMMDHAYHSQVTTEISQRIRELELIDKRRTKLIASPYH